MDKKKTSERKKERKGDEERAERQRIRGEGLGEEGMSRR